MAGTARPGTALKLGAAGPGGPFGPARISRQWDQPQRPVVGRVGALALALPFSSGLLCALAALWP